MRERGDESRLKEYCCSSAFSWDTAGDVCGKVFI